VARHLITSALPYINGVKHLGNLVGSMLPADVHARYLRAAGHEVLLICATDEHGTPAELAAAAVGQDVASYCAEQHEVQRGLCERWDLSWDHFGRTSAPQNHELTQHMARQLAANGLCERRVTSQMYSLTDERFLPDRYVIGTCPNCGFDRARGDQCEHCTKQLEPTELIEPRSAISGSTAVEVRDSAHLFLLQSQLQDRVREWIDTRSHWSPLVVGIARKWLDEGLRDRGITRDLEWGIPVPLDTFPDMAGKVFYVWFDAPIGYLGATREWADLDPSQRDWEAWWRTDRGAEDVTYTEFMGKDNVPFHTLSFPATIVGTGEPWKLVDRLKGFSYLTYEGGKFSTSEGRGVFMDEALEIQPADCWRWFLMVNAPESDDTDFTWPRFGDAVNKDLVATLGNFVNRTATQVGRLSGETVPSGGAPGEAEEALVATVRQLLTEYCEQHEAIEFRKAARTLRALWAAGNGYLDGRAPWKSIKTDPELAAMTLRTAVGLIRLYGVVSAPFLPQTARALDAVFDTTESQRPPLRPDLADAVLNETPGAAFHTPPLLFDKLAPEQLTEWEARFGGRGSVHS
jgi:methionyl-tRNA synthetase